jgi:hypothetical protein
MDDDETYHDLDGNPCSLEVAVRREPAWAANVIRTLRKRSEDLSESVAEADTRIATARAEALEEALSVLLGLPLHADPFECRRAIRALKEKP